MEEASFTVNEDASVGIQNKDLSMEVSEVNDVDSNQYLEACTNLAASEVFVDQVETLDSDIVKVSASADTSLHACQEPETVFTKPDSDIDDPANNLREHIMATTELVDSGSNLRFIGPPDSQLSASDRENILGVEYPRNVEPEKNLPQETTHEENSKALISKNIEDQIERPVALSTSLCSLSQQSDGNVSTAGFSSLANVEVEESSLKEGTKEGVQISKEHSDHDNMPQELEKRMEESEQDNSPGHSKAFHLVETAQVSEIGGVLTAEQGELKVGSATKGGQLSSLVTNSSLVSNDAVHSVFGGDLVEISANAEVWTEQLQFADSCLTFCDSIATEHEQDKTFFLCKSSEKSEFPCEAKYLQLKVSEALGASLQSEVSFKPISVMEDDTEKIIQENDVHATKAFAECEGPNIQVNACTSKTLENVSQVDELSSNICESMNAGSLRFKEPDSVKESDPAIIKPKDFPVQQEHSAACAVTVDVAPSRDITIVTDIIDSAEDTNLFGSKEGTIGGVAITVPQPEPEGLLAVQDVDHCHLNIEDGMKTSSSEPGAIASASKEISEVECGQEVGLKIQNVKHGNSSEANPRMHFVLEVLESSISATSNAATSGLLHVTDGPIVVNEGANLNVFQGEGIGLKSEGTEHQKISDDATETLVSSHPEVCTLEVSAQDSIELDSIVCNAVTTAESDKRGFIEKTHVEDEQSKGDMPMTPLNVSHVVQSQLRDSDQPMVVNLPTTASSSPGHVSHVVQSEIRDSDLSIVVNLHSTPSSVPGEDKHASVVATTNIESPLGLDQGVNLISTTLVTAKEIPKSGEGLKNPVLKPGEVLNDHGANPNVSINLHSVSEDLGSPAMIPSSRSHVIATRELASAELNIHEVPLKALLGHRPVTDSQQVQLRSQILVYGALLQGLLPDESYMIGAFMDNSSVIQESGKEQTRSSWESSWQTAAKSQNKFIQTQTHIPVLGSTTATPSGLLDSNSKGLFPPGTVSSPMLPAAIRSPVLDLRFSASAGSRSFSTGSGADIPSFSTFGNRSSLAAPLQSSGNVFSASAPTATLHVAETSRRLTGFQTSFTEPWQRAVGSYVLHPQISPFSAPSSTGWWSSSSYLKPPMPTDVRKAASVYTASYTVGGHPPQDDVSGNMGSSLQLLTPFVGSITGSSLTMSVADFAKNGKDARARRTTRMLEARARKRPKTDSYEPSLVPESVIVPDRYKEGSFLHIGRSNNESIYRPGTEVLYPSVNQTRNFSEALAKGIGDYAGITTPIPCPEVRNAAEARISNTESMNAVGRMSPSPAHINVTVGKSTYFPSMARIALPSTAQESVPTLGQPSFALQSKGSATFGCRLDDLSMSEARKLEEAKLLAENIEATASSALQLTQSFWNELSSHVNVNCSLDKESEVAFLSATITAATTAVKAAAAAGNIAYEAAVHARDIVGEVLKRSCSNSPAGTSKDVNGAQADMVSCIDGAKKASAERVGAASFSSKKASILEGVVQAVELAAKAASQAGAILTIGDSSPFSLHSLREGGIDVFLNSRQALTGGKTGLDIREVVRASKKNTMIANMNTDKLSSSIEVEAGVSAGKKEVNRPSQRGTVKRKGKDLAQMGIKRSKNTVKNSKHLQRDDLATNSITATKRSEAITAVAELILEAEEEKSRKTKESTLLEKIKLSKIAADIVEGITVEVIQEEDGTREGWFKAKVRKVEDGKVHVVYDDLYDDDEDHQLEECVSLPTSLDDPPRVRTLKDDGNPKRRRSTIGNQLWLIGDHIDALINDGWWEGIVKSVNEEDEKLVTVVLADGETTVMKSWNLRPSLTWKDGSWVPWTASPPDTFNQEDVNVAAKRQKTQKGYLEILGKDKTKLSPQTRIVSVERAPSKVKQVGEVARVWEKKTSSEKTIGSAKDTLPEKIEKDMSHRTSDTKAARQETSKVVFGVPKPTKKRKYMVDIEKAQTMDAVASKGTLKNEKTAGLIQKAQSFSHDKKKREQGAKENEVQGSRRVDLSQGKVKDISPKLDNLRASSARTSPTVAMKESAHGTSTRSSILSVKRKQANSSVVKDQSSAGLSASITGKPKPVKSLPSHFRRQLENLDRLQKRREENETGGSETDDFRRSRRLLQPSFKLLEGLQSTPKTMKKDG